MNAVITKLAHAFEVSLDEGGAITPPNEIGEFNSLDLISQKILIHKFRRYLDYLSKELSKSTPTTRTSVNHAIEDVHYVSREISLYNLKFPVMDDGEVSEEYVRELMHQRQLQQNRQRAKERTGSAFNIGASFDLPSSLASVKVPGSENLYDTVPVTEEQMDHARSVAIRVASEEAIEEAVEKWHAAIKAGKGEVSDGIVIDPCAPIVPGAPEQVDEGTDLYRFEVRYYEQNVPRIPSNRLRMFFWAKDYDHALEQFQDAEPTSISVVVINTGEEYVPGSV